MTTELPSWTDYTAAVADGHARYLEIAAAAFGLRVMNLGNGEVAIDAGAFGAFARQPEDATVSIEVASEFTGNERDMCLIWIQGTSYPLEPSFSTGVSAERNREADEALAWMEEGATYGDGK
jgi:hypothetical protein